jgi:hypothetical protein
VHKGGGIPQDHLHSLAGDTLEAVALRGADESGARAPRDGGGAAIMRTAIMAPSAGASS